MWQWLNSNAGAVQGIAAGIVAVLTGILVWVTAQYVRLTRDLVEAGNATLRSAFFPDLDVTIGRTFGNCNDIAVCITNKGQSPLRTTKAFLSGGIFPWSGDRESGKMFSTDSPIEIRPTSLEWASGLCMRPEESQSAVVRIEPAEGVEQSRWAAATEKFSPALRLGIECCDLAGKVYFYVIVQQNAHTSTIYTEYRSGGAQSIATIRPPGFVDGQKCRQRQ